MSKEFILKAEEVAEEVFRRWKTILPTIARLCLVSAFIDDGIRMWYRWSLLSDHMTTSWGWNYILVTLYIAFSVLSQLIGSGLIVTRFYVSIACSVLFGKIFLQTLIYEYLLHYYHLLRNLSLCGALLLLTAEAKVETRSLFAGVPSLGENRPKNYMQLFGRILTVLMFITTLHFDTNAIHILQNIFGIALMALVFIGYKTKLSALLLVIWLSGLNLYSNHFWTIESSEALHRALKHHFFQSLSYIGGMLLVVLLGPGGISIDNHKKQW